MQQTLTQKKVRALLKARNPNSHKGQNGRALIIGGSEELVGAPALAAMAALASLRSGTDLVTVAAPEKPAWVINSYSPDLIVHKMSGKRFAKKHLAVLLTLSKNNDVTLIGPGMGRHSETITLTKSFVRHAKSKLVIDADALKACAGLKFKNRSLVTPHEREFEIFSGKKIRGRGIGQKIKILSSVSRKHNCTILLKGKTDIIVDNGRARLNNTGSAGMTVGGTGDILAGLCTGFASLGNTLFDSASAAAFVNGMIGEKLEKKMGYSFTASDFLQEIPFWTKKLLQ